MILHRKNRHGGGTRWVCSTRKASLGEYVRTKHFLSNINEDKNVADCSICGPEMTMYSPKSGGFYCSVSGGNKAYRDSPWRDCEHCGCPVKRGSNQSKRKYCKDCSPPGNPRAIAMLRKYDLAWPEFEAMYFDQDGNCLICEYREAVFIDHDHSTGAVRGLLCSDCNGALGYVERPNWIEKANAYLRSELI